MRHLLCSSLLLMALCAPQTVLADHDDDVRFAAHFGLSYAIDDVSYRLYKKAFKMDTTNAQVFAAFTTIFIGVVYKTQENASGTEMLKSTLQNAAGIGAASVVHWMFEF